MGLMIRRIFGDYLEGTYMRDDHYYDNSLQGCDKASPEGLSDPPDSKTGRCEREHCGEGQG